MERGYPLPSCMFDLSEEAERRGVNMPSKDTLDKLFHYCELVRNGKASLKFSYYGINIGRCKRGRFKWDYTRLTELITTGTPSEFFMGITPNRVDKKGAKSNRPDYPWARASGRRQFIPEKDSQEHVDGISNFLEVDEIFVTVSYAVFYWNGTCSFEIDDINETFE